MTLGEQSIAGWLGSTSTQADPSDAGVRVLRCWFTSNDDTVGLTIDGHTAPPPPPPSGPQSDGSQSDGPTPDSPQSESYEGAWQVSAGESPSTPSSGKATAAFQVADQVTADVWLDRSAGATGADGADGPDRADGAPAG